MTIMPKTPVSQRFCPRVNFPADDLWLIRSVRTRPGGLVDTMYYETPAMWNRSPAHATVFTCYEAASAHLTMYHQRDRAPKGWADGTTEVLDVVPLITEMRYSSAAKPANTKGDSDGDDGA